MRVLCGVVFRDYGAQVTDGNTAAKIATKRLTA
jgi:hypothetical protein